MSAGSPARTRTHDNDGGDWTPPPQTKNADPLDKDRRLNLNIRRNAKDKGYPNHPVNSSHSALGTKAGPVFKARPAEDVPAAGLMPHGYIHGEMSTPPRRDLTRSKWLFCAYLDARACGDDEDTEKLFELWLTALRRATQ